MLDLGTSGQWLSIASALVVELPIAFLMFAAARRLIRLSALVADEPARRRASRPRPCGARPWSGTGRAEPR